MFLWSGSVGCPCSGKWTKSIINAVNAVCKTQCSSLAGIWQFSRFHFIHWLQTICSINLFIICVCKHLDCLSVPEIPTWGWQIWQRTSGRSTFSVMVAGWPRHIHHKCHHVPTFRKLTLCLDLCWLKLELTCRHLHCSSPKFSCLKENKFHPCYKYSQGVVQ